MAANPYPSFMQMEERVPRRVWDAIRVVSVCSAVSLCVGLFVMPDLALKVWWGFVIPVLPLVFFVAPGLWRNICPLATVNQTPRRSASRAGSRCRSGSTTTAT